MATSGVSNPQFTTAWTNQLDYQPKANPDTDLSGLPQATVTRADLVTAVQQELNRTDMEYLLDGSPTFMRKNMWRFDAEGDLAALTTQVMTSVAIPLFAGDTVTNLTFISGATAAGTPTNWWFALYSSAATPALLGQSADQTSTAWAANTVKTLALATPVPITTTGIYYAAVMVKATTVPTLVGATLNANAAAAVLTGQKVLAQTSGTTLTTTAPATIATPTTVGTMPFCIVT